MNYELNSNKLRDTIRAKEIDTIYNIETVKTFGTVDREIIEYEKLQSEDLKMDQSFSKANQLYSLLNTFVENGATFAALTIAAIAASREKLTVGDFVLINSYISELFRPLVNLSHSYRTVMRAAASVERVTRMFGTKPTIKGGPESVEEEDVKGELAFNNVYFKYKTRNRQTEALKDISFTIPAGGTLGVVGSSGSGKSTIVKLVTRLFDVDHGSITIDGKDIREFSIKSFRSLFGVVTQRTSLFRMSVKDNIAYGRPEASESEIWDAISGAALDEFCNGLEEGLETKVGDLGFNISGGERQRLGVARCIIRKPVFVILDEASSSLDSETEQVMQDNMNGICQDRTTIVVAHRLSTIMKADQIIVMEKGEVIERGTHEELLELQQKYYRMWQTQCGMNENS